MSPSAAKFSIAISCRISSSPASVLSAPASRSQVGAHSLIPWFPCDRKGVPQRPVTHQGLDLRRGKAWTVAVPYRNTQPEIDQCVADGVLVAEMEAAALFAASQVCGVASAAAVVVSDVWLETPKWEDPVPTTSPDA